MFPYVALGLALFGALWWMPVRVDGRADVNREPTLHIHCMIWKFRLAYDAVVERREGSLALSIRRRGGKHAPEPGAEAFVTTVRELRGAVLFLRGYPRAVRGLWRALRLRGLSVDMRVGVGDAAQTALLYGVCCAALEVLRRRVHTAARVRPAMRVRGDRSAAFLCSVRCIIDLHVGNIIGAALWLALEGIAGKVGSVWNGIQSKA